MTAVDRTIVSIRWSKPTFRFANGNEKVRQDTERFGIGMARLQPPTLLAIGGEEGALGWHAEKSRHPGRDDTLLHRFD